MSQVSIVTPAYNAALFLKDMVNSVIAQTFTNWEMIIVDDCSTDDTFSIAKSLEAKDSRIKVFRNDANLGVALTRNRALDIASGPYIAFLDADDLWEPRKLEKQIAFMESGQYVFTYTAYQFFDSKTGEMGKIIHPPKEMTTNKIYGDTSIACLTVIVNREISGPFHMPNIGHTEDNITWQDILSKGYKAYLLDEVLAYYRHGNGSLTMNKKKAAAQQWLTYRTYYRFSRIKSAYYFCCYAINAIKKHYL